MMGHTLVLISFVGIAALALAIPFWLFALALLAWALASDALLR